MADRIIEWTADLETGLIWQDLQHQALVERINSLYRAINSGRGKEYTEQLLDFLEFYVDNHLAIEDAYMAAHGFPGMQDHITQHKRFVETVSELGKAHTDLGQLEAESLCYDLFEWFKHHISNADKELGNFLQHAYKPAQ